MKFEVIFDSNIKRFFWRVCLPEFLGKGMSRDLYHRRFLHLPIQLRSTVWSLPLKEPLRYPFLRRNSQEERSELVSRRRSRCMLTRLECVYLAVLTKQSNTALHRHHQTSLFPMAAQPAESLLMRWGERVLPMWFSRGTSRSSATLGTDLFLSITTPLNLN